MTGGVPPAASQQERELQYYRRECNELGARLLRMQEEQTRAFQDARRSRTVVRLVRDAYRLAEPTPVADDVGSNVLQIIVENVLCDRAVLLREDPLGSGRFLLVHAIGGDSGERRDLTLIVNPPRFFFTSSRHDAHPPAGLMDVLGVPNILWAYDPSSGHALALGNRSEGNINHPFNAGDQELVETALSVYVDILYRKHAEIQLRQARQSVEEGNRKQSRSLEAVAQGLRLPILRIENLLQAFPPRSEQGEVNDLVQQIQSELARTSADLLNLANNAWLPSAMSEHRPLLDVQWLDLSGMVRGVFRSSYPVSVRGAIDLKVNLPDRAISVCVDRSYMQRSIKTIVNAYLARALPGSEVRLAAARRGDGAAEILITLLNEIGLGVHGETLLVLEEDGHVVTPVDPDADRMLAARRIVEAHGGSLIIESRVSGGRRARIILPAHIARDGESPA